MFRSIFKWALGIGAFFSCSVLMADNEKIIDASYSGASFAGASMKRAAVTNSSFVQCDFTGATLSSATFTTSVFSQTGFSGADFSGAKFVRSTFTSASFAGTNLSGATFSLSNIADTSFDNANLSGAIFNNSTLSGGTSFNNANISGAYFYSVTGLTRDLLSQTANWKNKDLSGITFWAGLVGWDFSGMNLTGTNFTGSTLTGTIFTDADITNANFSQTSTAGFVISQLYDTKNYKEGNLYGIKFNAVVLTGANFSNLDLRGASMNARFTNANFTDALVNYASFTGFWSPNDGISPAQLYSTKSYKNGDLSGLKLHGFQQKTTWDLSNMNLTDGDFDIARMGTVHTTNSILYNTRLCNAGITTNSSNYTIFNSLSYKNKNLHGLNLFGFDLSNENFAGQKLTNAFFSTCKLNNTDLTSADLRGARFSNGGTYADAILKNTILADGAVKNFGLTQAGDLLQIRNYEPMSGSAAITVKISESDGVISGGGRLEMEKGQQLLVTNNRTLTLGQGADLYFEADAGDSATPLILADSGASILIEDGAILTLDFGQATKLADRYFLFEGDVSAVGSVDNIVLNILGDCAGSHNWKLELDGSGLWLVGMPEPALSAALLGAGALVLASRRKRS